MVVWVDTANAKAWQHARVRGTANQISERFYVVIMKAGGLSSNETQDDGSNLSNRGSLYCTGGIDKEMSQPITSDFADGNLAHAVSRPLLIRTLKLIRMKMNRTVSMRQVP